MIYLCSPYSHPDPAIQQQRFEAVCKAAAELINQGIMVFSPIAHSHPLTEYGADGSWSYWQDFDLKMLDACDEVYVLMLDGWEESVGVKAEISYATRKGKAVRYVPLNLDVAYCKNPAEEPTF